MSAVTRASLGLGFCLVLVAVAGSDWPRFRGPGGQGVSKDKGFPVHWSAKENILWKLKLPGPGSSSPIVWKDRVFVTCYTGYGLVRGKSGDLQKLRRHLLCINRSSGNILWQKEVVALLPESDFSSMISEHGYASSTPGTDGEHVYVFFGRTGVLAFDFAGNQLWHKEVGKYVDGWGSASSPILYKDLVIVNASIESQSLVALNRKTGEQVWRAKDISSGWSSPILVEVPGGKVELVQTTSDELLGFDPDTGTQLWSCEGVTSATASSSPVSRNGIVYVMGAANAGGRTLMAVRAAGKGDVSKTHVVWKKKLGANHCSLLLYRDLLWWISGQVYCVRPDTGQLVFQERLYPTRQEYVSPVAAEGRIYAFTRYNGAFVLTAQGKFEQLAHNNLGDDSAFNASPALSNGHIFVRSNRFLYCIGQRRSSVGQP
jgi:outer membrane protein assembly factor BamB